MIGALRLMLIALLLIPAYILVGAAYDKIIADGQRIYCTGGLCVNGLPAARIEEDSPQWNCRTMGNHLCARDRGNR